MKTNKTVKQLHWSLAPIATYSGIVFLEISYCAKTFHIVGKNFSFGTENFVWYYIVSVGKSHKK